MTPKDKELFAMSIEAKITQIKPNCIIKLTEKIEALLEEARGIGRKLFLITVSA